MKTLVQWIDSYSVCHQNPANQLIHHVCVPSIQFSLLGLLWLVKIPFMDTLPYYVSNMAVLLTLVALLFYFYLSWRIALGMLLMTLVMLYGIDFLYTSDILLEAAIIIFVVAWVGQFIGHIIEGKKPSFFEDLRFLLIGPLWVLVHLYQALGIAPDKSQAR